MDTKCSSDTPTPQSRDGRRETPEITRIYKTKRVTQPTSAMLPESITVEGKANGRESSKRWDEKKRERGREKSERAKESRLSHGKRRAPATSSLTAVNGRSLRRNTVRERDRRNKRPRQMDEDGEDGVRKKERRRWGRLREKRKRKRRYLYYSKKSDRENRETGRLRPWQPARTSRRTEGPGGLSVARIKPAVHGKERYSIRFKGHAYCSEIIFYAK